MNLFLNLNESDKWLENNFPNNLNKTNFFINKKENESISDCFLNYIKLKNTQKEDITSINLIFSFKNYKEYEFFNLNNFISFNRKWNIKLVEEIQPLISFSKKNKNFLNFIFVHLDKGLHNIANIALVEILKNLTFSLNNESSFFKIFSKFIIFSKSKKKDLKKIEKIILDKKRMFLFKI